MFGLRRTYPILRCSSCERQAAINHFTSSPEPQEPVVRRSQRCRGSLFGRHLPRPAGQIIQGPRWWEGLKERARERNETKQRLSRSVLMRKRFFFYTYLHREAGRREGRRLGWGAGFRGRSKQQVALVARTGCLRAVTVPTRMRNCSLPQGVYQMVTVPARTRNLTKVTWSSGLWVFMSLGGLGPRHLLP